MKGRIRLRITLVLSIVLISLTSSDRAANAANGTNQALDTGMITLGPNQTLRLTVASPASGQGLAESISFSYAKVSYGQLSCNGGICQHSISSQIQREPITLMPDQAASIDITLPPGASGVGMTVNIVSAPGNRDVDVIGVIIDTTTGWNEGVFYVRQH